jgi:hypothetical protein
MTMCVCVRIGFTHCGEHLARWVMESILVDL